MRFNSRGEYHGGIPGRGSWLNDDKWLTQAEMDSAWLAAGNNRWADTTHTPRSNFDYSYPPGIIAKVWDIAVDGTVCEAPNYHEPYSCGVWPNRNLYPSFNEHVQFARAVVGGHFVARIGFQRVYSSRHGLITLPSGIQAFDIALVGDVLCFHTHIHMVLLNVVTGLGLRVSDSHYYPDLFPEPDGVILGFDWDAAGGGTTTAAVPFSALIEDLSNLSDSVGHTDTPSHTDAPPEEPMIPYELPVLESVDSQYPHLLQQNTKESCGEFTERAVLELAAKDARWGHVGKKPGQNQYRGHAVDAIMYRSEPDYAIDIIGGAGDQVPTSPQWGETESGGQPWMAPIPIEGENPPPLDNTHMYIGGENDTGICDTCGNSRFDSIHEIPGSKIPHNWDPGENGEGLCDICQKAKSDAIHLGEGPPPTEPDKIQDYLDNWLEENPDAQEYVTKLYHVPEGAVAPPDASHQLRLHATAEPTNHLTVAAVTTDKGAAFCNMILSMEG